MAPRRALIVPPDSIGAAEALRPDISRPLPLPARLLRRRHRCNACSHGKVRAAHVIAAALTAMLACERASADSPSSRLASAVRSDAQFAPFIAEASQRFGIPTPWIDAVMQAESAGDGHALSSAGAMGLMQIMPETWADLRERYGLGADPFQPHDNILAGAAYLRELHDRYGSPGFLAAYNAGPERWEAHVARSQELPGETRNYVARLLPLIMGGVAASTSAVASVSASWTEAALFPVQAADSSNATGLSVKPRSADAPANGRTALAPQSAGLFVTTSRLELFR